MKKLLIISLVLILLSASVVPVMAGKGSPNGHGNGNGNGNSGGNQDTTQDTVRDQDRERNRDRNSHSNSGTNGHSTHGNGWANTPFYLQGVITAGDKVTKTLTGAV